MTVKLPREERIQHIVEAAVSEFLEKGYDGASMEAIAKRAGISKGGLYHHFRNKDEVLVFANQVFMEPVEELMRQLSASATVAGGLELYILHYINHWVTHRKELEFYFLVMDKAFRDPNLLAAFGDYAGQMLEFLQGVYQAGIDAGEFANIDARKMAITFLSAVDGSLAYIMLNEAFEPVAVIEALQEILVTKYKN
ncbi:MAG TPA: TetR/AcrR family transcriptional regulator [Bacteroidales bacterium]|nr:TetR/AcrR family transcriptional regulator [Bacteroidales bacterium]